MDVLAIGTSTSGTPKGPLGRQQALPTYRSFALNILRFNKVNDVADALWRNAMNLNRALAYGGT